MFLQISHYWQMALGLKKYQWLSRRSVQLLANSNNVDFKHFHWKGLLCHLCGSSNYEDSCLTHVNLIPGQNCLREVYIYIFPKFSGFIWVGKYQNKSIFPSLSLPSLSPPIPHAPILYLSLFLKFELRTAESMIRQVVGRGAWEQGSYLLAMT